MVTNDNFFVNQSSWFSSSKKIFEITDESLNIVDISSNQKIKVSYTDIKEIQPLAKKPLDFSFHHLQKGKVLKETYSSNESFIIIREIKKRIQILSKDVKKYKGKDGDSEFQLFLVKSGFLVKEDVEKKISFYPLELLKKLYFLEFNAAVFNFENYKNLHFSVENLPELLLDMKTIFKTDLKISFPVVEKLESEKEMLQKEEFKLDSALFNFKLSDKTILTINQTLFKVDHENIFKISEITSLIRYEDDNQKFGIELRNGELLNFKTKERDIIILNLYQLLKNQKIQYSNLIRLNSTIQGKGRTFNVDYCDHLMKQISDSKNIDKNLKNFNSILVESNYTSNEKLLLKNIMEKFMKEKENYIILNLIDLMKSKYVFEDFQFYHKIITECLFSENSTTGFIFSILVSEMNSKYSKNDTLLIENQKVFLKNQKKIFELLEIRMNQQQDYSIWTYFVLSTILKIVKFHKSNSFPLYSLLFEKRYILYWLYQYTNSIPIKVAAIHLIKVLIKRLTNEKDVLLIQKEVLGNGLLIEALYHSLFSTVLELKKYSTKGFDLLISFYDESIDMMRRILPDCFFQILLKNSMIKIETKGLFSSSVVEKKTKSQKWKLFLQNLQKNYVSAEAVWNEETRKDLKDSLQQEIRNFKKRKLKFKDEIFSWNYIEFNVNYKSLKSFTKVGEYYIKYLTDEYDTSILQKSKIIPRQLISLLFYKLMMEENEEISLQCSRSMNHIYVTFMSNEIFPHLNNLISLMVDKNFSNQISFELLVMLGNIISMKSNLEILDKEKLIEMGMKYIQLTNKNSESEEILITLSSLSLNIILRILDNRTLENGKVLRPIPNFILILTNYFDLILTILETKNEKLFHQLFPLLKKIFDLNDLIVPTLYKTKLFYLLFSNLNQISRLTEDSVPLIKSIYKKQKYNGNFLERYLPRALLNFFEMDDGNFEKIYFENTNSPILIWNESMRNHLEGLIADYLKVNDFETLMDKVEYFELKDKLYFEGYYLENLVGSDYKVKNPNELYNAIIQHFQTEINEKNLEILMKIQILLISNYEIEIKEYENFDILLNMVSVYDKKYWNVKLVQVAIELFLILLSFKINQVKFMNLKNLNEQFNDESVQQSQEEEYNQPESSAWDIDNVYEQEYNQNQSSSYQEKQIVEDGNPKGFKILMSLLFSSYRKLREVENEKIEFKILIKNLLNLISLLFGLFSSTLFQDEVFYQLINYCFYNEDEVEIEDNLFEASFKLLLKFSKDKFIIKKIWDRGLPFLIFRNILSENLNDNLVKKKAFYSIRVLKYIQLNQENQFFYDLNLILPRNLVEILVYKPLDEAGYFKLEENFLKLIFSNQKEPNFYWNEETLTELKNYISYEFKSLTENKFQFNLATDIKKINYHLYKDELVVDSIFLSLFVKEENFNWKMKNPEIFGKYLISALDTNFNDLTKIELIFESFFVLLKKEKKLNLKVFDDSSENFKILFKFLSIFKNHSVLIKIIKELSLDSEFQKYLENIKVLNFFSYQFNILKQDFESENTKVQKLNEEILLDVVSMFEIYSKNYTLSNEILENGLLLYLLYFLFVDEKLANEIVKSKILQIFLNLSNNHQKILVENLRKILPIHFISDYLLDEKQTSKTFYNNDIKTPVLIWNFEMKKELLMFLNFEIRNYSENEQKKEQPHWVISQTLKYKNLEKYYTIDNVFISIYNEFENFRMFKFSNNSIGTSFLNALINELIESHQRNYSEIKQYSILFAISKYLNTSNPKESLNENFLNCSSTLFEILKSTQNIDILRKILEILFSLTKNRNIEFINRISFEEYIFILFDKIEQFNEEIEKFLLLIFYFSKESSLIVKQILEKDKFETLMNYLSLKNQFNTKICAYLLKVLMRDEKYGDQFQQKMELYLDVFADYKELEIPNTVNSLFKLELNYPKKFSLL
eukprot:gene6133-10141_t